MNKLLIFSIVFLIVLAGYFAFMFYCPLGQSVSEAVDNFEECAIAGYPVLESYPRQCKTPDGKTFTENIGNELEKSDLIRIDNPHPNQGIESPLKVIGEARGYWFFEASFPVKVFDDNGFLLGIKPAQALKEWMTEDFVPFSTTFPFTFPSTSKGKLILEKDNPSGLPEHADELIIPVYFTEAQEISPELMKVKIFLNDSQFVNEPYFDCSRTIAVERYVSKTKAVAKAALEALLRGAKEEEVNQGYISNIIPGARVQGLKIEEGVAYADFDEQLEFQTGGSCRVAGIRAQITETLMQFPTVNSVVLSINNRTQDILQP
ncbi:MAG: GerMN domain-containing protein [Candidatus Nealsonbacteria bacterium]